MTIVNRERYSCSARRERGTCSSPVGVAAAELEERVLGGLRSILLDQDAMIDEFARAFRAELDRLRKIRGSRDTAVHRELAKVERGIRRCLDFITEGDGDPGSVAATLRKLEARKTNLEADLRQSGTQTVIDIHPNVAELYRRKVGGLQALLADEASRMDAMDTVRALIERIEVHAGAKRGWPDVILVGALASILDYACSEIRTAASGGDGGRVLVVAGAGFGLCLPIAAKGLPANSLSGILLN